MNSTSNSFCVLPWIHRFINVDGNVGACCTSEEFDNLIYDNKNNVFNIENDLNESEIQNSNSLKKIRSDMLEGKWPTFCERCLTTEKMNGVSRRIIENNNYKKIIPTILKETKQDGETTINATSIDLRVGNTCNLACRMCNPRSSSTWLKDWNEYKGQPFYITEDNKKEYLNFDWYKRSPFKKYFEEILPTITHLHFAGGEPLIIKEMITILQYCVDHNLSSNIQLSYNTNLTIIPDKLIELLPFFKSTQFLVSIDAFGELNNLIRYPSKWEQIVKNLHLLDSKFFDLKISEIQIMCTVQMYNIFKLNELYDFLASQFKNIVPIPHLIDLYYPTYYQTRVLTLPQKKLATQLLESILAKITTKYKGIYNAQIDSLKGSIYFMNEADETKHLKAFYIAALEKDNKRKEEVFKLVPELLPYDS